MCWCERGWKFTHNTNFHGANKQNPTTFCLPDTHPYTKSLHTSNEIPPNMAPTSITSKTCQVVSTMTSTGSSSGTTNDVLCIQYSVATAGLNKLETQSTNPDIAELANAFQTMTNLN